ncbi:MAG: bifunctional glutamate N-acetyltransferase/amino-acid acetyltransferase ArgJ [OCS116 cluster bacterium]|nr:bifunctional glutamate N-acetyltransferase/amino-acid acetyltransferase ArgJ [OCS116 cluster bacterium]
MKTSPLVPAHFPDMPKVKGLEIKTYEARVVYKNRDDLLLVRFDQGTQVAGVFTKSRTRSASVDWCKKHLASGLDGRLLMVNSGNSNAFTGAAGERSVTDILAHLAAKFNIKADEIYTSSTGVIGQLLSGQDLLNVVDADAVSKVDNAYVAAANAIKTTDTFAKYATKSVSIDGAAVTINIIAKGSGMIAPDMATMLSYAFTDANISQNALQKILSVAVGKSFNSITVDSDTSTSDTVLLFATGGSDALHIDDADDTRLAEFVAAIDALCLEMAQQIVKDGEGASKFITVKIDGAEDDRAAKVIGLSIANSPLVKTAIAGEDANWGRIIMAIGKSGEMADRDLIEIAIGGVKITQNGQVVDGYDETPVTQHMQGQYVDIEVGLGLGDGAATIYTCDLTHGYIEINADYRS